MTTTTPTLRPVVEDSVRKVLASGARPARASALSACITHGWRALLKIKHVPEQMLDVTIFPIMMTVMFTYLFGGAIAGSTREYLQFLLPGIVAMTVTMITMYTGVGLNNDVAKGLFQRLKSLPVWQPSAIVGALMGDAARYTIAAAVVISLGLIMGYRPEGGAIGMLLAVPLIVLFAFSISWIWASLGLILRSEKAVMNMAMMTLFPFAFVSNIFVDPATMPAGLRAFVNVNPFSHLTTAVRGLMGGEPVFGDIALVFVASAVITGVFAPLTIRLYRNRN